MSTRCARLAEGARRTWRNDLVLGHRVPPDGLLDQLDEPWAEVLQHAHEAGPVVCALHDARARVEMTSNLGAPGRLVQGLAHAPHPRDGNPRRTPSRPRVCGRSHYAQHNQGTEACWIWHLTVTSDCAYWKYDLFAADSFLLKSTVHRDGIVPVADD